MLTLRALGFLSKPISQERTGTEVITIMKLRTILCAALHDARQARLHVGALAGACTVPQRAQLVDRVAQQQHIAQGNGHPRPGEGMAHIETVTHQNGARLEHGPRVQFAVGHGAQAILDGLCSGGNSLTQQERRF